jgi:alpha-1,2-mannosyltransferase
VYAVRVARQWHAPLAVGVLALLVRAAIVLRSAGGPTGLFGYDPGVYYAAGDALIHGRLPYRDFLLLHPPAVMLATAPFAAFGSWTNDETGFVFANFVFMCIGALNAALVTVTGRRLGLPESAARVAGVAYALWVGAAGAEISIRLEPLGTLMLLVCLLSVVPVVRGVGRGSAFLGGTFAGVACTVKIWWCVPVLVLATWVAVGTRRRSAVPRFLAGVGCGLAVVAGPFLALAPSAMWRMVVLDQLGRPRHTSLLVRAFEITGVGAAFGAHSRAGDVALAFACLVAVALGVASWRSRVRLPLVLLCVQVAVLVLSPSFFNFYDNYVAAAAALVMGSATTVRVGARWTRFAVVGAAAAGTVYVLIAGTYLSVSRRFPASELAGGVADARCVMSDSPSALIELDALSRGLAAGCPDWVDVSAVTYDSERASVSRPHNARWQATVLHYLRSGDAMIAVRAASGIDRATRSAVDGDCVLASDGPYSVYRTSAHDQPRLPPAACEASLDPHRRSVRASG